MRCRCSRKRSTKRVIKRESRPVESCDRNAGLAAVDSASLLDSVRDTMWQLASQAADMKAESLPYSKPSLRILSDPVGDVEGGDLFSSTN